MDVTNLLLTGPPRVGKTTLIQRLLERCLTIALRGNQFMESLKQRPDVRTILVSPENRDRLVQELLTWLQRVL